MLANTNGGDWSEFVDPTKTERLELRPAPNGRARWIEIKQQLCAGEDRHVFTGMLRPDSELHAGERPRLAPELVGVTKILEYLVGWSFTDREGRPIAISLDALNQLKPVTYVEIYNAIEAYDAASRATDEALLKNVPGAPGSNPTSPSVAPPEAGPSVTSTD